MSILSSGKVAARVETGLFHAGATTVNGQNLGNVNTAHYQMRATNTRTFLIPLASKGAIDLGFGLRHNFTAAGTGVVLTVTITAGFDMTPVATEGTAGAVVYSQKLWTGTIPADGRFIFVSERGSGGDSGTAARKVIEIPELRQPIDRIVVEIAPAVAPDAGDLYIRSTWRY